MSATARFAPMTAELLARKGEARLFNLHATDETSIVRRDVVREFDASTFPFPLKNAAAANGSSTRPEKPSGTNGVSSGTTDWPAANGAAMPAAVPDALFDAGGFSTGRPAPGRRHSISLHVTDNEFERLALIAVKRRVNKQQLFRLAIDHYLEKLAQEYRSDCHCISASGSCCGEEAE
jgi:hypothetical protein